MDAHILTEVPRPLVRLFLILTTLVDELVRDVRPHGADSFGDRIEDLVVVGHNDLKLRPLLRCLRLQSVDVVDFLSCY